MQPRGTVGREKGTSVNRDEHRAGDGWRGSAPAEKKVVGMGSKHQVSFYTLLLFLNSESILDLQQITKIWSSVLGGEVS